MKNKKNASGKAARPLKRDFTDRWTREETAQVLQDALLSPAAKMDMPLIRECVLSLDPAYEEGVAARSHDVWMKIQDAITPPRPAIPIRRAAAVSLAAVMMLALAAAAIAAASRGVFNFLWDFGMDRSGAIVQEGAHSLLRVDLAHLSLDHVDVDVREAVYDGHDVRVVYSVWERGATEYLTEEDIHKPVIDKGSLDGLTCCDWIEINGQTVYLFNTFQAIGDRPGEMLYYLQTNLASWGITDVGDTLTIGLPMLLRADGPGAYVPEALRFEFSAEIPEGLVRKARPIEAAISGMPFALEVAEFSPVSAIVRIAIRGTQEEIDRIAMEWGGARVYDEQGREVGITTLSGWDYRDPACVRVEYSVSPPDTWPSAMWLALPGGQGKPEEGRAIPIVLE